MAGLDYYITCFSKLRRDRKAGGAPHKPVLLLSLIDQYEKGLIAGHKVYLSPDLVGSFKSVWSQLVQSKHHMIFALPFYHMQSEPFWRLVPMPGCAQWIASKSSMRSFQNLQTAVDHVEIDEPLASLLMNEGSRAVLKAFLLDKYFPHYVDSLQYPLVDMLNRYKEQMVEESPAVYQKRIKDLSETLDQHEFEEEVYMRSGIFKREIAKVYKHTCAITGLRIDATITVSMIDACHIVPFAQSHDDTIGNGIALCPTMHRAFDRGLISIDENYSVLCSPQFTENGLSHHGIRQFDGKPILLPASEKFYPAQENLAIHRKQFGF